MTSVSALQRARDHGAQRPAAQARRVAFAFGRQLEQARRQQCLARPRALVGPQRRPGIVERIAQKCQSFGSVHGTLAHKRPRTNPDRSIWFQFLRRRFEPSARRGAIIMSDVARTEVRRYFVVWGGQCEPCERKESKG